MATSSVKMIASRNASSWFVSAASTDNLKITNNDTLSSAVSYEFSGGTEEEGSSRIGDEDLR